MAGEMNNPVASSDEAHERDLNRHRGDEERRVRAEIAERLAGRGIAVGDRESDEAVVELWDAVEAFERGVEARGGDLMVDTPPAPRPDDRRFVIPRRGDGESIDEYTMRVRAAADRLRVPRAD